MAEIIDFQEQSEQPVQQAPKFDPTKKYTWARNANFTLSGDEFGQLLNALRIITSTKEAQTIILAKEAGDSLENVLVNAVETGLAVEVVENKSSL